MTVAEGQGNPGKESHSVAPKHLGNKGGSSSQQPQQGTSLPVCSRTTSRGGEGQGERLGDSQEVGSSACRGQHS